jgi:hypothetical protein
MDLYIHSPILLHGIVLILVYILYHDPYDLHPFLRHLNSSLCYPQGSVTLVSPGKETPHCVPLASKLKADLGIR